MKVSCFTFLRNAETLGYPFVESIKSALPLCDEFIVNIGPSEDNTLKMVKEIDDPKIRIIENQWNEKMLVKGYVYGQQKSIALFNCTGDWAFYLEGDEVLHEDDLPKIRQAMEKHLNNDKIEALIFNYVHFYGTPDTYAWSPGWYRRAPRIIRNTIRAFATDGLFFVVLDKNKNGRYPRAAFAKAIIYNYGWVRSEKNMNAKIEQMSKYWGGNQEKVDYSQIDQKILHKFRGMHPQVMSEWLLNCDKGLYIADPAHVLTKLEKKCRLMLKLEKLFGLELSKKYYKLVE
ncbi:MAG: glycosyltransferase [Desulfuromonadales bacterium]|nr:glycosyltransferase [Desulfuromonadales bacterium]